MKKTSAQIKRIFSNTKRQFFVILILTGILLIMPGITNQDSNSANAASTNLIKNGSFEADIESFWYSWQSTSSKRTYDIYRSYESYYGFGSYALGINSTGSSEDMFNAGINSNATSNAFNVEAGKTYYLVFFAKSDSTTRIKTYLSQADNYAAITEIKDVDLTTGWEKKIITFKPTASTKAILSFVYGANPDNNDIVIDGIQLYEYNIVLGTKEVGGFIGDVNKAIALGNASYFNQYEIFIELPYYSSATGEPTVKKFNPVKVDEKNIYINMYEQTFSGIGKVYVKDNLIGSFNYKVTPKITEIHPELMRANEDLVITGTGFIPKTSNTFVIVNAVNLQGKQYENWITPHSFDSNLKQVVATMPSGVISGKVYIYTSFANMDGIDVVTKSNAIAYKVKPVIYKAEWSKRGYEHVGDSILIYGKGLGNKAIVNFYDSNNKKIESKPTTIKQISPEEIVESGTTKKTNTAYITVTVGGVESDTASALYYEARPRMISIVGKYSRALYDSKNTIPASKVGGEVTIKGEGFTASTSQAFVEFQGTNKRIKVAVDTANIASGGTSLKVTVPAGAQNGYVNTIINNQYSNSMPLEIVPTVNSVEPTPVVPGQHITIHANGVGSNLYLAQIYFVTNGAQEIAATPNAITFVNDEAVIDVTAPLSLPDNSSTVNIQYDKWRDDGEYTINIKPTITSASMNMDSQTLTIRGYGFSITPAENKITYKYADGTVITPKVKVLGVYATEDGQEIRVQILDDYHYGLVSVTVGTETSNEVSFGPVTVSKIARRVQYVQSEGAVMGVLYISGYNFGTQGGVKVGDIWADVHYRTNYFIIAVVPAANVYDNPVVVAKQ